MFSLPLPCRCFFSPFITFFLLTHIDQVCALVHRATLQDTNTLDEHVIAAAAMDHVNRTPAPPPFVSLSSYSNYSPPSGCKEKPGDLKSEHVVHKLAETRVALLSGKYIFTTPHCPCLLLSSSPPLSPSSSSRSSYAHYLYSALPDGLSRALCSDKLPIKQRALARLSM